MLDLSELKVDILCPLFTMRHAPHDRFCREKKRRARGHLGHRYECQRHQKSSHYNTYSSQRSLIIVPANSQRTKISMYSGRTMMMKNRSLLLRRGEGIVRAVLLLMVILLIDERAVAEVNELGQETYDFDASWAIRSANLSSKFGNKQSLYDDFMDGCRRAAGDSAKNDCDDGESFRLKMNRYQPGAMRVRGPRLAIHVLVVTHSDGSLRFSVFLLIYQIELYQCWVQENQGPARSL